MKNLKKVTAMALSGTMVLPMMAGASVNAAEETAYEEHLSVSIGVIGDDNVDYNDEFLAWLEEKFNCDIELWNTGSGEKTSLLINAGTMPDTMNVDDISVSGLHEYAEQGLIQELPEGWREQYPNLFAMSDKSGETDPNMVDGDDYAIIHSVFGNFLEIDPIPTHLTISFRKDLAEEVGMADLGSDYTITESEAKAYLDALKENNLIAMPYLGSDIANTGIWHWASYLTGCCTKPFYDNGEEWVWTPATDEYKEMIAKIRDWYQNGYVDPDIYVKSGDDYKAAFYSGQLPMLYGSGPAFTLQTNVEQYIANTEGGQAEDIGFAHIVCDDGSSYINGVGNSWTCNLFSPECSEENMHRILAIMDWVSSEEGQISTQVGIPGVDWQYAEDGETIQVINQPEYNSIKVLYLLGYCGDDFAFAPVENGTTEEQYIETVKELYALKADGTVFISDPNYNNFQSESMDNYSVDRVSKACEIAYGEEDIDTAWDAYVEEQRALWEPLLNDLNAEYYGK